MTDNADNPFPPKFVDIFCGAGGFSLGFKQAGFEHVMGVDNCSEHLKTYRYNIGHALLKDVRHLKGTEEIFKGVDVLIGSPPCQSFSKCNIHTRTNNTSLIAEFMRLVKVINPRVWIWENVYEARKHVPEGKVHTFFGTDIGMLQNRKRIFVSNIDLKPKMLEWDKQWLTGKRLEGLVALDRNNIYKPFCTITGRSCGTKGSTGYFEGHIRERNKGIRNYTLEEAMQLQTLPFWWEFKGRSKTSIGQQLGDMVPPMMAYKIAKYVYNMMNLRMI